MIRNDGEGVVTYIGMAYIARGSFKCTQYAKMSLSN